TVASEVMAILCLARDLADFKARVERIIVAETPSGELVEARALKAAGAMAVLMKDAIKPNLVQTIAGTPAMVHGGPFANIAHGCNSVIATNTGRRLADVVVTEAGFGADLGAEKFMDIKARYAHCPPSAVVLVATIRALKMHGGVAKDALGAEDVGAVRAGLPNLARHVRNIGKFGLSPVVAVNRFGGDTQDELDAVLEWCAAEGVEAAVADVWARGGDGAVELAVKVLEAVDRPSGFHHLYDLDLPVEEKIRTIVRDIYGGADVEFSATARKRLEEIAANGWDDLPVCMAKTQYSFSDDASLLGAPDGFTLQVRDLLPKTGAGFIVALTGAVMTMPGLPKVPAAMRMDVDADGNAVGLF
ncbi:MAG TPA: formate--tetrahydrofolate ligase, partial [Arthrobacter sp.]|nr:formate--tetrahydrofolate ligase [Arthrobacter sp.]